MEEDLETQLTEEKLEEIKKSKPCGSIGKILIKAGIYTGVIGIIAFGPKYLIPDFDSPKKQEIVSSSVINMPVPSVCKTKIKLESDMGYGASYSVFCSDEKGRELICKPSWNGKYDCYILIDNSGD